MNIDNKQAELRQWYGGGGWSQIGLQVIVFQLVKVHTLPTRISNSLKGLTMYSRCDGVSGSLLARSGVARVTRLTTGCHLTEQPGDTAKVVIAGDGVEGREEALLRLVSRR